PADTSVKHHSALPQRLRIQVALHSDSGLKNLTRPLEFYFGIETHAVNPCCVHKFGVRLPCTSRKSDHRYIGMDRLETSHYLPDRFDGPPCKILLIEQPRPALENLDDVSARIDLRCQVLYGDVHQHLHQLPEPFRPFPGCGNGKLMGGTSTPSDHV